MIKMNTLALLATSAVAVFAGSGCSSNIGRTSDSVTQTKPSVKLQKASLRSSDDTVYIQKAAYRRNAVSTRSHSNDADTWDRIFHGFQLGTETHNPRVQQFVRYYGRSPQHVSLLSQRASTYLHMIMHEVDRRNMPTELALLPFVESAFDADVFSHAGAAGLWQFIPDTGKRYGLRQNKAYDGRMDPFAATGAALSYLQELHDEFGDWYLALAAYNCGEKRIEKEIARNRSKGLPADFWHLSLPRETREYVPRLLAFKELLSHSERYGISLADTPNEARLTQLHIDKPVNLRQVAMQAGLDARHLLELNPYFRDGIANPQYSNRIILPREHFQRVSQALNAQPATVTRAVYAKNNRNGYNTLATTRVKSRTLRFAQYNRSRPVVATTEQPQQYYQMPYV
jgi:membrane-bound lytic murein transglycosylase D